MLIVQADASDSTATKFASGMVSKQSQPVASPKMRIAFKMSGRDEDSDDDDDAVCFANTACNTSCNTAAKSRVASSGHVVDSKLACQHRHRLFRMSALDEDSDDEGVQRQERTAVREAAPAPRLRLFRMSALDEDTDDDDDEGVQRQERAPVREQTPEPAAQSVMQRLGSAALALVQWPLRLAMACCPW